MSECVYLAGNTLPSNRRVGTNTVMTPMAAIPDPIALIRLAADGRVSDQLVASVEGWVLGGWGRARGEVGCCDVGLLAGFPRRICV